MFNEAEIALFRTIGMTPVFDPRWSAVGAVSVTNVAYLSALSFSPVR